MSDRTEKEGSTLGRLLYRVFITLVLPFVPVWLLIGLAIQAVPEYWSELKTVYRMYPSAFRKGSPL